MGFFEYLSWRYQTWVGRMSGEAMVYIAFSLGIWFWRIVNAMMLVLLPCGVLKLAEKAAGIRTKISAGRVGCSSKRLSSDGDYDRWICGNLDQRFHFLYMVIYLWDLGTGSGCRYCI